MIFIDTGAFIARYRPSDDFHEEAIDAWKQLQAGSKRLITSQLVLFEAARLLWAIRDGAYAADRLTEWLSSTVLRVVRTTPELDLGAATLMKKFADQSIGPVDCVSFMIMKRLKVKRAFTFDKHYAIAGFEVWPGARRK